jgi:nucleotide-binding universal stress UspA family protein
MLKPVNSILFATDLTANCQQALEFTISMGVRLNAVIYMLHVIENLPGDFSHQLKDLLGHHQWDEIASENMSTIRRSLLGKKATNPMIREKLRDFCRLVGVDEGTCDFQSREIIISTGDIVEAIIENATKNECDLIVLGAPEGFLSRNSIGQKIKSILKSSPIPVTVVPAAAS